MFFDEYLNDQIELENIKSIMLGGSNDVIVLPKGYRSEDIRYDGKSLFIPREVEENASRLRLDRKLLNMHREFPEEVRQF